MLKCAQAVHEEYIKALETAQLDELASASGWTLTAQEAEYLTPISDNVALARVCAATLTASTTA